MVEEAKAQQAAEAAAQFLELPNETPLLLERLHTLRATHPHLPRAGGLRAPVAEGPGAKPFAASWHWVEEVWDVVQQCQYVVEQKPMHKPFWWVKLKSFAWSEMKDLRWGNKIC
jgi:hypothetical protein